MYCIVIFETGSCNTFYLPCRWHEFQRLANERKQALESALNLQNYHLECNELQSWMKEKTKVIESTQGLGNDLAGVMALQRKLTGMERDLEAIQVQCLDILDIHQDVMLVDEAVKVTSQIFTVQ